MATQKVKRKFLIRKRDIIPYFNQGLSSSHIGKIFDKSTPTIDRYIKDLREAGYNLPHRKHGRKIVPLD